MICPLVRTVDEVLQDPAAIELIPPDTRAGVAALARRLPEAMHGFGFEIRTQPETSQVDFYTSVTARGGGREAWAAFQPALVDASPADAEAWQRVGAFARRWAAPTSPLYARVDTVFLEFDAPFTSGRPPSIFARLETDVGDGGQQWKQTIPAINEITAVLFGQPVGGATRTLLESAFRALPAGGRIVDVAAMLPRGSLAVRLFIALPRAHLARYLGDLGWTDGQPTLARIDEALLGGCSHLSLQIDVGERLGSRVGIELSGAGAQDAANDWPAIGGRLQRLGFCSPRRAEALARWPGIGAPSGALSAEGGRWPTQVVRVLSHVKLIVDPSHPPGHPPGHPPSRLPGHSVEAKVYLWATRRYVPLT
ncbi:MAG: hypothetical protein QOI66_2251 [Myxococcales bacterium]|jgi:hypothetical protein|nr:hypothetical protein [Myxococcales bacterium]